MADKKISALTGATTPLAGTEELPIVQSGVTRKVSVANLTAGRAMSATEITLSTGNLVIGTSGKGIDFSATPGTGTSELLADYEEGTWTPAVNTGTVTATDATYTKIGNTVRVCASLSNFSDRATVTDVLLTGLPFTAARAQMAGPANGRYLATLINSVYISAPTYGTFYATSSGNYATLKHSNLSASASAAILFSAVYETT